MEPFRAFRTEVPSEILQALRMGEVNLQSQLDMPFLLSLSPGEVASHFNQVAGLYAIDTAMSNIDSMVRTTKLNEEVNARRLQEAQEASSKFAYLDKMEASLEVLEKMESDCQRGWKVHGVLGGLVKDIQSISGDIEEYDSLLSLEEPVSLVLGHYEASRDISTRIKDLYVILGRISGVSDEIKRYERVLSVGCRVDACLALYAEVQSIRKKVSELDDMIRRILKGENLIEVRTKEYDRMRAEYAEMFPDVCPLCDTVIKKKDGKKSSP
jgi:hypothetical protein